MSFNASTGGVKKGVGRKCLKLYKSLTWIGYYLIAPLCGLINMQQAKKKNRQTDEALGRSRGGYSSKVHVSLDALGNPRHVMLTGRQVHDLQMAARLIKDEQTGAIVANKAYDSDLFIAFIEKAGAQAVIPPKANRLEQRVYDENLYADRNKVERFFNRLKHYRRLATRYEKTARNFLAFWHLACCLMLTL